MSDRLSSIVWASAMASIVGFVAYVIASYYATGYQPRPIARGEVRTVADRFAYRCEARSLYSVDDATGGEIVKRCAALSKRYAAAARAEYALAQRRGHTLTAGIATADALERWERRLLIY